MIFSGRWRLPSWCAISLAGLFSLPPVILRGPAFEGMFDTAHMFAVSLVIHVNASVLFWLTGVLHALTEDALPAESRSRPFSLSVSLYFAGLAGLILSGFLPGAEAVKNNYVPVIHQPVFFAALGAFGIHLLLMCAKAAKHARALAKSAHGAAALCAYACCALAVPVIAADALTASPALKAAGALPYFEHVFWAGGHLIVAGYSFLTAALWLRLSGYPESEPSVKAEYALKTVLFLHLASAVIAVILYYINNNAGVFTTHMRIFGGAAPLAAGIAALATALRGRKARGPVAAASLWCSAFLFAAGGALGFAITGENTSVPSHYHGSIVGVTLAGMGYFFFTLPGAVKARAAAVALSLYAAGQTAHISGLYLMGGYGALRKEAHGAADATAAGKALFFAGGGLAMLSALAFSLLYLLREIRLRRPHAAPQKLFDN